MADKSIDQDYESIKQDISQLRSDLASLLHTAKESGRDSFSRAQSEASERIRSGTDKVARKAGEVGERIEAQYEERPLIFMIAAFVIGIVLARVFTHK